MTNTTQPQPVITNLTFVDDQEYTAKLDPAAHPDNECVDCYTPVGANALMVRNQFRVELGHMCQDCARNEGGDW